ncbi:MAG: hypothetical protein ABJF10_26715 [Chthoniobacter sp.]|uniref:hypothetical protein n=1 Tax=Chthoniobacter sp. TaxID=2510640 RepID=UPI0032A19AE5
MKLLAPLLALAVFASSAWGCLGDTEAELVQRYGKQTKTGTSHLPGVSIRGYMYKGFLIVVGVLNGKSSFEMYTKKDGTKMNGAEVGALMTANSKGQTWGEDKGTTPDDAKWVLADGTVFAEWAKVQGSRLTVMTSEAQDLENRTPAATPTPPPAKKAPETPKKP